MRYAPCFVNLLKDKLNKADKVVACFIMLVILQWLYIETCISYKGISENKENHAERYLVIFSIYNDICRMFTVIKNFHVQFLHIIFS